MNDSNEPIHPVRPSFIGDRGLTKREYFAAMAMQGLLTCTMDTDCSIEELCQDAISAADSLLEGLGKCK